MTDIGSSISDLEREILFPINEWLKLSAQSSDAAREYFMQSLGDSESVVRGAMSALIDSAVNENAIQRQVIIDTKKYPGLE
jgi:hypothetical protein